MSLSLNKPKLDNLSGDIWKSAERLRGKFKAYEYPGVILKEGEVCAIADRAARLAELETARLNHA
jgi:type I restriction enzyme M protein